MFDMKQYIDSIFYTLSIMYRRNVRSFRAVRVVAALGFCDCEPVICNISWIGLGDSTREKYWVIINRTPSVT